MHLPIKPKVWKPSGDGRAFVRFSYGEHEFQGVIIYAGKGRTIDVITATITYLGVDAELAKSKTKLRGDLATFSDRYGLALNLDPTETPNKYAVRSPETIVWKSVTWPKIEHTESPITLAADDSYSGLLDDSLFQTALSEWVENWRVKVKSRERLGAIELDDATYKPSPLNRLTTRFYDSI